MKRLCVLLAFALVGCSTAEYTPHVLTRGDYIEINHKMQPHIKKAKESLPYVKARYQSGELIEDKLVLTVKLYDPDHSFEFATVVVDDWTGDSVMGHITSKLFVLQQYNPGDMISFKDDEVVDWAIVKKDGKREGDYVRHFLQGCGAR